MRNPNDRMDGYGTAYIDQIKEHFNYEDPRGSVENLLPLVQLRQSPISILKHYAMGSNPLYKYYDFKVIWLTRQFSHAMASMKLTTPKIDGGERGHGLVEATNHLYILEELKHMPPESIVHIDESELNTKEGQTKVMKKLTDAFGWKPCEECFKTWKIKTDADGVKGLPKDIMEFPDFTMALENLILEAHKGYPQMPQMSWS